MALSSREEHYLEHRPSQHQIGGWIAVSSEGLQGKGSPKRNDFFTDTCSHRRPPEKVAPLRQRPPEDTRTFGYSAEGGAVDRGCSGLG